MTVDLAAVAEDVRTIELAARRVRRKIDAEPPKTAAAPRIQRKPAADPKTVAEPPALILPRTPAERLAADPAPHGIELLSNPHSNGQTMRAHYGILWHHTGGMWDAVGPKGVDGYVARNPRLDGGLSCHAVIHLDGTIVLVAVAPDDLAWHAGASLDRMGHVRRLKGGHNVKPAANRTGPADDGTGPRTGANSKGSMNAVTVGVEIVGTRGVPPNAEQYASALWLTAASNRKVYAWRAGGEIDSRNTMLGHWEFTVRKQDPWLDFDAMQLARSRARNHCRAHPDGPLWDDLWHVGD